MKLLAIDPGYERVGIAIIEKENKGKENLVYSECFKTDAKLPFIERLLALGTEIARVIKKYKPDGLAIEKLYMTTNQKTAMQVAEARGVTIYEASKLGLPIYEYTPMEIKVAVTGYGKATKDDVFFMVKKLIELPDSRKIIDDEIDAIAVGLTCFACQKFK